MKASFKVTIVSNSCSPDRNVLGENALSNEVVDCLDFGVTAGKACCKSEVVPATNRERASEVLVDIPAYCSCDFLVERVA